MKRMIITNNKKVEEKLDKRAEIVFKNVTALEILEQGKSTAEQGGRLLIDPTRAGAKAYYRSLPFLMGKEGPHQISIDMINQCIEAITGGKKTTVKEPILAGLAQNKDVDTVCKVIG